MNVIPKQYKHNPIQNRVLVIIVIMIKFMNQNAAVVKFVIQKKVLLMLLISMLGSADSKTHSS